MSGSERSILSFICWCIALQLWIECRNNQSHKITEKRQKLGVSGINLNLRTSTTRMRGTAWINDSSRSLADGPITNDRPGLLARAARTVKAISRHFCSQSFKMQDIEINVFSPIELYIGVMCSVCTFPSLATGARQAQGPKVVLCLWFLQYFAYFAEAAEQTTPPGPARNQIFELILRKRRRDGHGSPKLACTFRNWTRLSRMEFPLV